MNVPMIITNLRDLVVSTLFWGPQNRLSNVGIGLGGRVPIIWAVWDTVLQELQQLENLLGTLYNKSLHFSLHLIFHIAD